MAELLKTPEISELSSRQSSNADSFLQSAEWEEIQKRYGRKTARLSCGGREILCIQNDIRWGLFYWYLPRPHIESAEALFSVTDTLSRKNLFFRIEPANKLGTLSPHVRKASNLQSQETIFVNLLRTEDELLAAMHPKTRYNIRLAMRHGVSVEPRSGELALSDFYALLRQTAVRDSFSLHPVRYYEILTSANSKDFSNELFFASHNGELAAAAMVNFYKGVATYLHGASNYEFRHTMAPYLLHWNIMNEAKRRGFAAYDFGGINEQKWPGVTRFKRGFGGVGYAFPEAFDVPHSSLKYLAYRVGRFVSDLI